MEPRPDRADRDVQRLRDLLVAEVAPGDLQQHVAVACGQPGERVAQRTADRLRRDVRADLLGEAVGAGPAVGLARGSRHRPVPRLLPPPLPGYLLGEDAEQPGAGVGTFALVSVATR